MVISQNTTVLPELVINSTTTKKVNFMDGIKKFFVDNSAWVLIALTAAVGYFAYSLDFKKVMKR
jgi:hypothetical protein